MTNDIMIPAIDANGNHYAIEKLEAHKLGVLHEAISVFLFAGDDLLIQRRALSKYHCGGLWANTCCTHPHWGETHRDAANRRMSEELGVTVPLREVSVIEYRADVGGGLIEHENVHVYRGDVKKSELKISPNPDEVCETRWISIDALSDEMKASPEQFAPWFKIYWTRWTELHLTLAA